MIRTIDARFYNNSVAYFLSRSQSNVYFQLHSSAMGNSYVLTPEAWDALPIAHGYHRPVPTDVRPRAEVWVMQTSGGTIYVVNIVTGDRVNSVFDFEQRNRADFCAAELNFALGNTNQEPDIEQYPDSESSD